jgi:hypothetical protein
LRMDQPTTLPTDPFDRILAQVIGLPPGVHTKPSLVQAIDFYGHSSQFTVQTIRTEDGDYVFITTMSAGKAERYVLPPKVSETIARQRDTMSTKVRSKIGKERAEQLRAEGKLPTLSPEARAKGLKARQEKAAKRKGRKSRP